MGTSQDSSGFPLSDQISGDYTIIKLLGQGGMGEVYLAEQIRVGRRRVALKVLSRTTSDNEEIKRRFENEASSAGRIHHRNVVMVYESRITADGQVYVAMEYVDGKTLRDEIAERGTLPLDEIVEITRQVCAGLSAAHKFGIVHRDVKPDNIMLTREDDGEFVVKVLDFGIARLLEPGGEASQTKTGVVMGTPYYMSPEQALGNTGDKIDPRSDLYSLAMVVYQMLTGQVAFQSDSWMQVMYKHIHEQPVPPSRLRPDLANLAEVETVLLKALAKNRDDRQPTVLDFSMQLSAALAHAEPSGSAEGQTIAYGSGAAPQMPFGAAQSTLGTQPGAPPAGTSEVTRAGDASGPGAPTMNTEPAAKPVTGGLTAAAIPSRAKFWTARNVAIIIFIVAGTIAIVRFFINRPHEGETRAESRRTAARSRTMPSMIPMSFTVSHVNDKGEIDGTERGQARYFTEDLSDDVSIEMVEIPEGKFMMGTAAGPDQVEHQHESPLHEVTVRPFFLGEYEVTEAQWAAVARMPKIARDLDPDPSAFKGNPRVPVQNVSWWDAQEFCERLSNAKGRVYRLPTEAEWEYACRAGTTTPFYLGETITSNLVNFDAHYPYGAAPRGQTLQHPVPAGSLGAPNRFGLGNMHGNMAEWCLDGWHEDYNGAPGDGSMWEAGADESVKVIRGGSWSDGGNDCRSAVRHKYPPDLRQPTVGFRIAMVLPAKK